MWKSSQTYKEKSDRKIALLMFFALKALFYKVSALPWRIIGFSIHGEKLP